MKYLVAYLATGLVFLGMDGVWLSTVGATFYRTTLGDILIDGFRIAPAAAFYALYIAGIVIFAVSPWIDAADGRAMDSLGRPFMWGALFGFFAYITYDLTNQATLRNWTLSLTLLDVAWGSLATAVASAAGVAMTRFAMRTFGMH